ncbi:MAG: hypothetical protein R3E79_02835 [Caldilineaceae bacterium]
MQLLAILEEEEEKKRPYAMPYNWNSLQANNTLVAASNGSSLQSGLGAGHPVGA